MMNENQTAASAPQRRGTFPQAQPIVTYAILAILVVVFLAIFAADQTVPFYEPNPVLTFGVLDYDSILRNGEFYRLFTAMFLHLSWAHLLFNGYALYTLGRGLESVMGHARFLIIYLISGLSGSIFSFVIGRGASAGASGAIFGLFGAELVFMYRHRALLGKAADNAIRQLLILAALNLGLGFLTAAAPGGIRIDNWGHIGGLVGGLVAASALAPQFYVTFGEGGVPTLNDERPLRARWPMAAGLLAVEVAAVAAGYLLLPR